jgi:hypothetical protein
MRVIVRKKGDVSPLTYDCLTYSSSLRGALGLTRLKPISHCRQAPPRGTSNEHNKYCSTKVKQGSTFRSEPSTTRLIIPGVEFSTVRTLLAVLVR